MVLKNDYTREVYKAKKRGDKRAAAYWQAQIGALTKERGDAAAARAQARNPKTSSYQVKAGDNWFSIAEQVYGDQRMAGLLMETNARIAVLSQGQVLNLLPMPVLEPDGAVFFSQHTIDTGLEIEADRKELTTPPDAGADFSPEDIDELAQVVADAMDALEALDKGEVDPATPGDHSQITGAPQPQPSLD